MAEPNADHRTYTYHATLPRWMALLVAAPLLLIVFSLALTLLTGGLAAAFVLPLFLRRRLRDTPPRSDKTTIDLDPTQYTRVESHPRQLPHE